MANSERVQLVWDWCASAYSRYAGRRLSLPGNTDPTKTYQWRYVQRVADRMQQWGLGDDESRRFIEISVAYAKERGILDKGLALLCQGNLLDVCHRRLLQEQERGQGQFDQLRITRAWYTEAVGDRWRETLLARRTPDAECNLTLWYKQRRLYDLYLSLSTDCGRALARLQQLRPGERAQLPSQARLYITRLGFLQDAAIEAEAKAALGGDWRPCP